MPGQDVKLGLTWFSGFEVHWYLNMPGDRAQCPCLVVAELLWPWSGEVGL